MTLLDGALTLVLCTFWLHMLLDHWSEETEKGGDASGGREPETPPQGKGGWMV